MVAPASLPPDGIVGLDASWSRLVADGAGRRWHLLDNGAVDPSLTLLCVHGNPSWSFLFRELVARAPDGVRVVAVDQLDMGFSERTGETRRLGTRVDDLVELTDSLGLSGPVVTVAHDWGGPISLGWALRHLDRLAGVVLMNTAVHQPAGSPAPSLIRLVRSGPLLRASTVRTTAFIRGAFDLSRPRPSAAVRAGFLAPYASPDRRRAIGEFVADIPLSPDHPSAHDLDAIAAGLERLADTPALLVWGARDPVFSDRYLHDLEARLPHADVHRYPAASHFVSEDADATGTIIDWLGNLDRPRSTRPDAAPSTIGDTHADLGSTPAIAEMTGDRTEVDFAELDRLVAATAAGLAGAGVEPGDRVAVLVPPGVDLAVSLYACWRLGAVVVLVDSGLGPRNMHAAVRVADPDHLIGIPKALGAARALGWAGRRFSTEPLDERRRRLLGVEGDLPGLRAAGGPAVDGPTGTDPAAVVFTSGSTGPSKGVRYAHRQLEAQRDALARLYDITSADRLVAAFAPFALYGPALGITSVVPDMDVAAPGTLTAAALGDAAVRADATLVFASPAALANVVRTAGSLTDRHRAAFARVRMILSAGAPVRPSLLRAAADLFPNASAHTPYGMTECLPVASITLDEIDAVGRRGGVCVGRPVPGVDVAIGPLDHAGQPTSDVVTAPGVLGEVVVRADHARAGYDRLWRTEHLASQPEGWHRTGDVGTLDDDGRLWIGGRLMHVISSPDGPVAPVRWEQAIEDLDGVAMAAIVGVGPTGRQRIVAVVERVEPAGPGPAGTAFVDEVRAAVEPDVVAVLEVPHIPVDRRHNSKVDRTRLAEWAADVLAGGRVGSP